MKGLALTSIIGSIILACCFQLSAAGPTGPTDAILAYTDSDGADHAISLPDNECIDFDKSLKNATYIARGSNPASLYPAHGCKGAATAIAPRQEYNGPTMMLSVKKASTA
jgi:hypothetical protein